jgi:hypothetical protein
MFVPSTIQRGTDIPIHLEPNVRVMRSPALLGGPGWLAGETPVPVRTAGLIAKLPMVKVNAALGQQFPGAVRRVSRWVDDDTWATRGT